MKKIIVILIAMLTLAACSNKPTDNDVPQNITEAVTEVVTNVENPDFRSVKWGMSKESVIANEGTPSSEKEFGETGDNFYSLVYNNVSVSDYTAELRYYFENNRLTGADYKFDCSNKTDLQINSMYLVLHDEYIEKYGNPVKSSFMMLNSDYSGLTEPPYINDINFSFGEMASYNDEWTNQSGANISMSMSYNAMEGTEKSITFLIEYKAVSSDI